MNPYGRLRPGDIVEILTKDEILRQLDGNGCYEGVPFMPEMFQYCGSRMRVSKRAHKTCDFVTNTGIRELPNAVHLEDSRCDGSAHGGCQARCQIFWKEAWLKLIDGENQSNSVVKEKSRAIIPIITHATGCSETTVRMSCSVAGKENVGMFYKCQATSLPEYTRQVAWYDIRHFIEDYSSGNVTTLVSMIPRFVYRFYDNMINLGIGWGAALRWIYDSVQKLRGGYPYPGRTGSIAAGSTTPSQLLSLKPGELVKVKAYEDILRTLDSTAKNRGMGFSAEMVPYCGKIFRVLSVVTKIVNEKTGELIDMKNPCIILDGVTCKALYTKRMLFCPRATYPYWREIWLERCSESLS